jgi:hypothetical protein
MDHKSSLYLINKDTSDAIILDIAETAYERQAHLTCLILELAPVLPYYAYGTTAYGGMNTQTTGPSWLSKHTLR